MRSSSCMAAAAADLRTVASMWMRIIGGGAGPTPCKKGGGRCQEMTMMGNGLHLLGMAKATTKFIQRSVVKLGNLSNFAAVLAFWWIGQGWMGGN